MDYVLERINDDYADKILNDPRCDEKKKRYLSMRGGYFKGYPLGIAIDKEKNYFLFLSPRVDVRRPEREYYFFADDVAFTLEERAVGKVEFKDLDGLKVDEGIINEIQEAFLIHKRYGLGENADHGVDTSLLGEKNINEKARSER